MLARIVNKLSSKTCSRCFSVSRVNEAFIPHDNLKSDLLDLDGLVPKKEEEIFKRNKWNEQEHEPSAEHCYGTINITAKGYDMVVVEKFSQIIHRFILQQKITVKEVYALPAENVSVHHINQKLSIDKKEMQQEAELMLYTRIIQILNLKSTLAPILLRSLARDVPPGVTLSVEKHTEEHYYKRYKENTELIEANKMLALLKSIRG